MTRPDQVSFSARLKGIDPLRAGIVAGAGFVLVASAMVTMAASPSPSPSSAAGSPPTMPSGPAGRWGGGPGGGQGMGRFAFGFGPGVRGGGEVPAGQITIAAINGSSVSLKTADGWSRTFSVTSSTTLTKGGQTIALGDLKVGDTVRLRETRNSDGSYTITRLDVVVPQVAGSVTATSGTGFTLKARDGTTWNVTVTASTSYSLGSTGGSRSDLKVGSEVVVAGTQGSGNSLTAISVRIEVPQVVGQVTAKSGSTLTIKTFNGTTMTVHVSSATTYHVGGITNASLNDITVGMTVSVQGTQNSDGSIAALVVAGGRGFGGHGPAFGPGPKGPMNGPSSSPSQG